MAFVKDADTNVTNFGDLSPTALCLIIVRLILVPVIIVGNVLIVATVVHIQKLHTPHGYVLFAIAVVDLSIGAVACPLELVSVLPETKVAIRSHTWACAVTYHTVDGTAVLSFDLLTMLCVVRCLSCWKPIWYRIHMTRRKVIAGLMGLLVFRVICRMLKFIFEDFGHYSDTDWNVSGKDCFSVRDTFVNWVQYASMSCLIVEIVISLCACALVAVKTLKKQRRRHSVSENSFTSNSFYTKLRLNIVLTLMFLFILLWLPATVMSLLSSASNIDISSTTVGITRIIRFSNSAFNAPIYAMAQPEFRKAFKYLMTSPPWEWKLLQKWKNSCGPDDLERDISVIWSRHTNRRWTQHSSWPRCLDPRIDSFTSPTTHDDYSDRELGRAEERGASPPRTSYSWDTSLEEFSCPAAVSTLPPKNTVAVPPSTMQKFLQELAVVITATSMDHDPDPPAAGGVATKHSSLSTFASTYSSPPSSSVYVEDTVRHEPSPDTDTSSTSC